jgi:hypothetical protein
MAQITRVDSKAKYFDLRDFDPVGQERERYLLCLNSNTYRVVFSLFQFYAYWLNRYVVNQDSPLWYQPDPESSEATWVGDMYDVGMEELANVACMSVLTDMLEDINQTLVDLKSILETALERVGDVVEAQTTMQETRSIADTVAQTTNVNNLIAELTSLAARLGPAGGGTLYQAISALEFYCSPDVNLACSPDVYVSVSGGNTGTQIDQDSGTEGGTAPGGTTNPDAISGRKCKAANMLVDNLTAIMSNLANQNTGILNTAGIVPTSDLLGTIINTVGGWLGSVVNAVAGQVLAVATWILSKAGLDISNISSALGENRDDLVCALYNATTASQARDDFITVLGTAGLSTIETGLVALFLPNSVTNVLFFASAGSETILADYVTETTCFNCASCQLMVVDWGTKTGELSATSAADGVYAGKIKVLFNATQEEESCGDPVNVSISLTGFTAAGGNPWRAIQAYSDIAGVNNLYNENTPWVGTLEGIKRVDLYSSTSFTVHFVQS